MGKSGAVCGPAVEGGQGGGMFCGYSVCLVLLSGMWEDAACSVCDDSSESFCLCLRNLHVPQE